MLGVARSSLYGGSCSFLGHYISKILLASTSTHAYDLDHMQLILILNVVIGYSLRIFARPKITLALGHKPFFGFDHSHSKLKERN